MNRSLGVQLRLLRRPVHALQSAAEAGRRGRSAAEAGRRGQSAAEAGRRGRSVAQARVRGGSGAPARRTREAANKLKEYPYPFTVLRGTGARDREKMFGTRVVSLSRAPVACGAHATEWHEYISLLSVSCISLLSVSYISLLDLSPVLSLISFSCPLRSSCQSAAESACARSLSPSLSRSPPPSLALPYSVSGG